MRPRPFAWPMRNGVLLAISPLEGLAFAWAVGWTCFQTGRWEEHVERCIRELLRPGDTAIDVEELAAVRGALRTLEECRPSIIFEYAETHARHGGWTLAELDRSIRSCADHRFYEIRDDGFRAIPDLATYVPPEGSYGADLLATCGPPPPASKS